MDMKKPHSKLLAIFGTQRRIADVALVSQPYVSKVFRGEAQFGPASCVALERDGAGLITRQELRPDDYWLIWPELPKAQPKKAHRKLHATIAPAKIAA
jgi:DNA-binding transcriptional regulator YdaS (Cro superfamily)